MWWDDLSTAILFPFERLVFAVNKLLGLKIRRLEILSRKRTVDFAVSLGTWMSVIEGVSGLIRYQFEVVVSVLCFGSSPVIVSPCFVEIKYSEPVWEPCIALEFHEMKSGVP